MGIVRIIGLIILGISLLTFIALFGQLPRLRKTPIGAAHRLLRYKVPRALASVDRRVTGGLCGPFVLRCSHYLLKEKHPLVMAFYVTLVSGGTYMFIVDGWTYLTLSQKIFVAFLVPTPYVTLYIVAYSDPGFITPANHTSSLELYPYDFINFFPDKICYTCNLQKPARSKHCSICRGCISKHDHHCIWVNNCIGHNNVRYFMLFLVTTNIYIGTGAYLCFGILIGLIKRQGISWNSLSWKDALGVFGLNLFSEVYIGAVFLMSCLMNILVTVFTLYHLYLIWAGTTTNETEKWNVWKDDIYRGKLYMADQDDDEGSSPLDEEELCVTWPRRSRQVMQLCEAGDTSDLPRNLLWRRVESLDEVDNIYDIGWKGNLMGVILPKKVKGHS
ncbi:DHHC palmitoyltransferase-domain-containing protein [Geopyxis carbonaria]|nr:DHHC palmitoyltransferase-domain-containing protein [Geopyxis carbonaria]